MANNKQIDTSGKPNYEQNIVAPSETMPALEEPTFQEKTAGSPGIEDVVKYHTNRPTRDIIYAKITKQEYPEKPCLISKETKTRE